MNRFPILFALSALLVANLPFANAAAPSPSPVNQVFQFMERGTCTAWSDGQPSKATSYLWIPESCQRVRGLLILCTNVPEHRLVGHAAIRAISQDHAVMPLLGVDPARIYVLTSALGGLLVGLAGCLLVFQYDVHPAIGLTFGPLIFLICVLGGLGNLLGGMAASFLFAQFISLGGFFLQVEWGHVMAFVFFILVMFWRPRGLFTKLG